MKKLIILITLTTLVLFVTACVQQVDYPNAAETTITTTQPENLYIPPDWWPEGLVYHVPGSITIHPDEQFSSFVDISNPLKFRAVFYNISSVFTDLVDTEERHELFREFGDEYLNTMMLLHFVQHFNISREDFENAVEELKNIRTYLGHDMFDEWYEIPNADIIFTFDNDIINYFYRRE